MFLEPSFTHYFMNYVLRENPRGLLLTMNIDGLEEYFGLNDDPKDKYGCQVQVLHGSLRHAVCNTCSRTVKVDQELLSLFKGGYSPPCTECNGGRFKREVKKGILEPDIQLYDQDNRFYQHFNAREKEIGKPSIVFVLGTSLKSNDGIAHVKKWRRESNAVIIYVDRDPKPRLAIKRLFDYHLVMDCDTLFKKMTEMCNVDLLAYSKPVHERILKEQKSLLTQHIRQDLEELTDQEFKSVLSFFRRR